MTGPGPRDGRRRLVAAASALSMVAALTLVAPVAAIPLPTVTVNPAAGGSAISLDTSSLAALPSWTTLGGPSFVGTVAGDISTGSIVLTAPAGFQFNGAGSVNATGSGAGCAGITIGAPSPSAGSVTIGVTGATSGACAVSVSGLQVQPTTAGPTLVPASSYIGIGGTTAFSFLVGANAGFLAAVPGVAKVLTFTGQPSAFAIGGVPFGLQPTVHATDQFNNPATGRSIALGLTGGNPSATLTCASNTVAADSSGDAVFAGCSINRTSLSAYQLTARNNLLGALVLATSTDILVSAGPASRLLFTQWPSSPTPSLLSPQPVVQVTDAGGNPVLTGGIPVTLSLTGPFTGQLSCASDISFPNVKYTNASGTAVFSNCTVTPTGSYSLHAMAPLLADADSPFFTVGGASGQVAFSTQPLGASIGSNPPSGAAGVPWAIQPAVALKSSGGVVLFGDNSSLVTLTITPGTPTTGGPGTLTCTGGNTVRVIQGVATFSGCSIDKIGTNYQLRATVTTSGTVPVGAHADSLLFNIGVGTQLAFTQYPSVSVPLAAGAVWPAASQPVVSLVNGAGQIVTTAPAYTVQLAIATGTGTAGAILTCANIGNQAVMVNGSATFSGCKIDKIGTGYKLIASVTLLGGPASVTGAAFNVSLAATTITLTTFPSVVTWGDPFTLTIQFSIAGNHTFTVQRLSPIDNGIWQTIPGATSVYTTDATGRSVIQSSPRFNGQYRVQFAGDTTAGAATSNTTTVNVRNLVLLRPTWSGTKTVSKGFTETYQATVRPVPAGGIPGGVASVEFQFWKLSGSTWVKTKVVIVGLNSSGVGTLKYTWNTSGQWYIRARTQPNIYNFWATSDLERINVQ